MKGSLLLQTLNVFTAEELEQLGSFVACKAFNQGSHSKQNLRLFTLISESIKTGKENDLNQEFLLKNLGHQANQVEIDTHYLDNRMSDIMAVTRKYILWREVQARWGPAFERLATARFYHEKQLFSKAEQELRKANSELHKVSPDMKEFHILEYWVEAEALAFENFFNNRTGDLNISAVIKALTTFYGTKILEIALISAQQERMVPGFKQPWSEVIQNIRLVLGKYNHLDNPVSRVMEQALQLFEKESQNPLDALNSYLTLFKANKLSIPLHITKDLAAFARNYCIHKIAQGHIELQRIQLSLYKEHLKNGWLHENAKIPQSTFINMINIALKLKDYNWAIEILQSFENKIGGHNPERIIEYCYAHYHFATMDIEQTEEYLRKVFFKKKFEDRGLEKLITILEIKVAYERDEQNISNKLHNFNMLLIRSKGRLAKNMLIADKNFINTLKNMVTIRESKRTIYKYDVYKDNDYKMILKNIENPNFPVAEREWLLEKVKLL